MFKERGRYAASCLHASSNSGILEAVFGLLIALGGEFFYAVIEQGRQKGLRR